LTTPTEVEGNSDSILDSADKLGIGRIGLRREVSRPRFTVDREQATQTQLDSATVTPGSNRVGKPDRLGAALHPNTTEGVGHKALAKSRVHRSQQEIRISSPYQIRGALIKAGLRRHGGNA
jgi:hypothetical protein